MSVLTPWLHRLLGVLIALGIIAAVTAAYTSIDAANTTTVALTYLVAILMVATKWDVLASTVASLTAVVCLNFFFLPPVGTLTIADPQNWIALVAFLATAIMASQLSDRARRRTLDAVSRQRDLERLYALSRALLISDDSAATPSAVARNIATTFELPAVAVYDHHTGTISRGGPIDLPGIESRLREVSRQGVWLHEPNAVLVTAISLGGVPIGSLAIKGTGLSDTVLQSIANLAAIGLERARGEEASARAEAARRSGELRATVLDALAHEFKTPLTSMKAAVTALLAALPDGFRDRELVVIIDEDTTRLESLVTDAVHMLRLEGGDFVVHREHHTVADLVQRTLSELGSRRDEHVMINSVPTSLVVDADGDLLRLALRQLVDNAIKYSPATSTIELAAVEKDDSVGVTVRNSGPPIPQRDQARIFDRFYRGADARQVPGTGMGLAIVRQIAQAHGGTLTLSSSPEMDTAFTLWLPRAQGPS